MVLESKCFPSINKGKDLKRWVDIPKSLYANNIPKQWILLIKGFSVHIENIKVSYIYREKDIHFSSFFKVS